MGEWPPKILGDKTSFAAQQCFTKTFRYFVIKFQCFVIWEKSVPDLGRKKEQKNEKKKFITAKSGVVGIKGYHNTYNRVKYFLPYLSRF